LTEWNGVQLNDLTPLSPGEATIIARYMGEVSDFAKNETERAIYIRVMETLLKMGKNADQ